MMLFEWLVTVAKQQLFLSNDSLLQLDGGVVSLSMEEIKRAYPNVRTLVGNSIYVKASVLTTSGRGLQGHVYLKIQQKKAAFISVT